MKTIQRSLYVVLALVLFATALPACGQSSEGEAGLGIVARLDASATRMWRIVWGGWGAVHRAWESTPHELEHASSHRRIGPDIDSGGVAVPSPNANTAPTAQLPQGPATSAN